MNEIESALHQLAFFIIHHKFVKNITVLIDGIVDEELIKKLEARFPKVKFNLMVTPMTTGDVTLISVLRRD